jgi:hypothetical protein
VEKSPSLQTGDWGPGENAKRMTLSLIKMKNERKEYLFGLVKLKK